LSAKIGMRFESHYILFYNTAVNQGDKFLRSNSSNSDLCQRRYQGNISIQVQLWWKVVSPIYRWKLQV